MGLKRGQKNDGMMKQTDEESKRSTGKQPQGVSVACSMSMTDQSVKLRYEGNSAG